MAESITQTLTFNQEVLIQNNCRTLLLKFMDAVDRFDHEGAVDLFSADCRLTIPGKELLGRQALTGWLDKRPRNRKTRHVCSNILFHQVAENSAQSRSIITLYAVSTDNAKGEPAALSGPAAIVDLTNQFTLTESGWKITVHHADFSIVGR